MNNSTNSLSENNPCYECPSNCCNPLVVGFPKKIISPLPKGGASSEMIIEAEKGLIQISKSFVEEVLQWPKDERFSLKGVHLGTKVQEDLATEIIYINNIHLINLHLRLALECVAFDQTTKTCTKYDTRPDICRDFSAETCGLSKISRPKQKSDGSLYDISEIVEINRELHNTLIKPTIEEAIFVLREELDTISV